jgi:DNA repair exonuclease SbcCD ATPase subunit
MTIKLQSLTLRNFRGVKCLTVDLRGNDSSISGPNGAGKTTIVDAFLWLLFGKNSENQGQFEIKTLDADNHPIHFLNHEVEASIDVDGRIVTLRKLYKEKWVRSRGKAEQEFDGHSTDHWINDEPVKAKDYAAYISGIVDDEVFRLITNPLYFSTKLHWEKRRETLLAICGEISIDTVIDACSGGDSDTRDKLVELLHDGRSDDTARKVLKDRLRRVNEELEKIPAQIDALNRTIPETQPKYSAIESELQGCKADIESFDLQAQSASRALEPIREKGRELANLERERNAIVTRIDSEARSGYEDAKQNRIRLEDQLRRHDETIESLRSVFERSTEKANFSEKELADLRIEYDSIYSTQPVGLTPDAFMCQTCGQDLPADKHTQILEDAKVRFETQKTASLESVKEKGAKAREAHDAILSESERHKTDLEDAIGKRPAIQASLDSYRKAEEELTPTETVCYADNTEYAELTAKIDALTAELDNSPIDNTSDISAQRASVQARMEGLVKELATRDAISRTQIEIERYAERERELSNQITEIEGQLYMLENYVRSEAKLLESSINAKFKTIRFRLFEEQINGGLKPTCEAVVNGVQFSEANTADQFNAGMEIIDALCTHYNVYAPVFVDRCESINCLTPIESQVIRMIVVGDDAMGIMGSIKGAVVARAARNNVIIKIENKKEEAV